MSEFCSGQLYQFSFSTHTGPSDAEVKYYFYNETSAPDGPVCVGYLIIVLTLNHSTETFEMSLE